MKGKGTWKGYLFEGLIILLPLTLSIIILFFLFRFFSSPLDQWIQTLFPNLPYMAITSEILAFVITLNLILFIGYLGRRWILAALWDGIHRLLLKVPVIRKIYHSCYEVVTTLLRKEERGFSQVVTFPYGDTNGYVVSLLPRKDIEIKHYLPVLLPGSPNPLQGFLLFVDDKKIHFSELPVEKAIKWTISIGTISLK